MPRYNAPHILSPLKYIKAQCAITLNNPRTGEPVTVFHPAYHDARRQAARGNGSFVRSMAQYIQSNPSYLSQV